MKYIKTFDSIQPNAKQTYWKIRADSPYLETSLYKLNLPDKQIKYILNNEVISSGKYEYIYIPDANINLNVWNSWGSHDYNENKNGYQEKKINFMNFIKKWNQFDSIFKLFCYC
jgi:uncharacterized protein YgiM (DUF1202 family)